MRLLQVFALCFAVVFPVLAQERAPTPVENEAAVRKLIRSYVEARQRKDESAIEALFAQDADQRTTSGEWRRGREAVVKGSLASSERIAGMREIRIETVRFPAPGVAIADGPYEIRGAPEGTRSMWTTFVLTRGEAGWRIAAIRNMVPTPDVLPAPRAGSRP
jgi:uncharacterized protein (TIGR02246 family)